MSGGDSLRDAESPKAFSDANPAFSLQKPILLAVISVSAGYLFGSASLSVLMLLGVVVECFSDVIVGNILMPPFADNRHPSEGLTERKGKVAGRLASSFSPHTRHDPHRNPNANPNPNPNPDTTSSLGVSQRSCRNGQTKAHGLFALPAASVQYP